MVRTGGRDTIEREALRPPAGWAWARQWDFWLALALGATLRLTWLNLTQFLDDQTRLMALARASVTHGLIPLTGIPSSIHTLNPPLSVYLLLPFAANTADPMPAVVCIALWNVAGVGLCYMFTLRYFGRRLAAVSALLFATCGAAINYSRFIWQQNYLPPLLTLWALTLYLGCVEGRRRWLTANVALLALAAQLHVVALLLTPVTLIAVALAPRLPRWRVWLTSALALIALAAPTLLWETLSGFSDLRVARAFALSPTHVNAAVFYYLFLAIGSPDASVSGTAVPFLVLNVIATLLFAAGWLVLTARVWRPARALAWRGDLPYSAALRAWLAALYHGLRASAPWKINTLLWLSVTLPVGLLIPHSVNLFAHYLMALYPTAFIVSGIGALAILDWLSRAAGGPGVRWGAWSALALLLIARSAQWLSYPASLTNAATFHAYATSGYDYGYPLATIQGGADELARMQARTGAGGVEVITPSDPRYRLPADYIFAGGRADWVTLTPDCALLPSASSSASWLVTAVTPTAPALALLASLPSARAIGTYHMTGGPDYPAYQVTGQASAPAGMRTVDPDVFSDGQGDALQIEGVAALGGSSLAVRWRVISLRASATEKRYVTVTASAGGRVGSTTCEAQRWQTGETLYTIIPLAGARDDIQLVLSSGTHGLDIRVAGGLRFLSALDGGAPAQPMKASLMETTGSQLAAQINTDGSITIPPP
jgi:hypothetical protein